MESKDWISIAGIVSTLLIALITILINSRREYRQETQREEERSREYQYKIKEKEYEFRFGKLHEKRVQILSEVFERLVSVREEMDHFPFYMRIAERKSDLWISPINEANMNYEECASFFAKNKLYISKDLANMISEVLSDLGTFLLQVHNYLQSKLESEELEPPSSLVEEWNGKKVSIDDALKYIEVEFREILGSET